ncbi:MAG TPA: hypothetical protein VI319_14490, partial [Burkholderiales bacterium]
MERRRALHPERREAAREPRAPEHALRVVRVVHVAHEESGLVVAHEAAQLLGDALQLLHARRDAGLGFVRVLRAREMRGRDEDRLLRGLDAQPRPEQAPLGLEVADFLGAVLGLFQHRAVPVDVALVRPARKRIAHARVVLQHAVEKLLRRALQLLDA